jgi:hypothetical protein
MGYALPQEVVMVAIRKLIYFCTAVTFASALFAAADPFVGRWKLDLAQTTTKPDNPTAPRPKQVTLIARDRGETREVTIQGINADGSPIKGGFTIPISGGPGRVADANDSYDGITMKYVSAMVPDLIYTKGDRAVARRRVEMSQDLKTMTSTYKGADAEGKPITRVEVWRKQQ